MMQRVIDTRPAQLRNPPASHEPGALAQRWAAASLLRAGTPPECLSAEVMRDGVWAKATWPTPKALADTALDAIGQGAPAVRGGPCRAPKTVRCTTDTDITRPIPLEYARGYRQIQTLRRQRLALAVWAVAATVAAVVGVLL